MLRYTFIHIPGIGYRTEKDLWRRGIWTWTDFIQKKERVPMRTSTRKFVLGYLEESKKHLQNKNHHYFARILPQREVWRAYNEFSDSVAFLDIETTGLRKEEDYVTMIGVFDGERTKTFTRGRNLFQFPHEIGKYKCIITYNGARFDIPFIQTTFPNLRLNQIHIDIMYPLRRLGYRGGLKAIEREVGIDRSEETESLTGHHAVILWQDYLRGDDSALDILEKYNKEDTANLKVLSDIAYNELRREMLGVD